MAKKVKIEQEGGEIEYLKIKKNNIFSLWF